MGPVREGILKFRAARELRRLGHDADEIEMAFRMVGRDALAAAVADAKASEGVAALGDGTLITAFLEWLKSEQGQAVIAALVKILLAALGV